MANYVIDFIDSMSPEQVQFFLEANSLIAKLGFENFPNTVVVQTAESDNAFVPDASLYQEVETIENGEVRIKLLTDYVVDSIAINPASADKWWYNAISIPDGVSVDDEWKLMRRGRFSTVYMVDSGCDIDHPEFEGRAVTRLWSFLGDNHEDTNGHGTALTSVISGKTLGMSQTAVKQVKVFDAHNPTTLSSIIEAFDAIISDHILSPTNKVVNLSWSIPKNQTIEAKITVMRELGLHVVCASGNSGAIIADITPASMASITTVGSFGPEYRPSDFTDVTDSAISLTRDKNNNGVGLDVWAPGENILAAKAGGGYAVVAGTSVAAAIFSGCAATYLGSYPDITIQNPDDLYQFNGMRQKFDLLDFSDTRYEACPNRIVLVRTAQDEPFVTNGYLGIYHPSEQVFKRIILPETVESVEIEGIPSWLTYADGSLTGTAPEVADPTAFRCVLIATTNGVTTEALLVAYVVPSEVDKEFSSVTDISEPLDYVMLGRFGCGCTQGNKTYCCSCFQKGGNDCVGFPSDCINFSDPNVDCP